MKINRNFDNLVPNYLFADVAKKTNASHSSYDKPVHKKHTVFEKDSENKAIKRCRFRRIRKAV